MIRIQIVVRSKDLNGVKEPLKIDRILENMKFLLMIQTESLPDPEGM